MSPELARRIRDRDSLRHEATAEEELEIIADWLSGSAIAPLSRKYRRGKRRIQAIIADAKAEAERVLASDG